MPGPKKPQRTKGNVKPSSSSQAAKLLAASGHALAGFIGFSSQPAFVPASETFDDAESAIDSDFRLALRRLSKRDSVTKIKALQEFIGLCSSKDEDCIKAVVPFWPRVYNKIAIDVDHKVRELSQKALGALAARAGKALAPHLKSIMGLWMVSMCDVYPVVATAANSAFTNTFSAAKQTEAVRFCKAEIAECLMSNVLQHTPQTLSDPLTTSQEDMESKYERIVSSSLQAFKKLVFMLPSDSVRDAVLVYMIKLLDSPNFWKHSKSTVPQIKCGVLSVLSATCQLCPEASGNVISKVAPFIFSCLDSQDSSVVSHTWEAVLALIRAHEDCWQHVNWQKAVWPKIKRVLENGCFGQAAIVCPCLLPLLSKIPNRNFTQFFDSFRLGLREESVLHSPLDMSALVQSFVECIHYSVKCVAEAGKSTSDIRGLILDQVLVVVQASLTDSKPGLSKTDLYARLSPLISAVGKIDVSVEVEFWSELSTFIRSRLVMEFVSAEEGLSGGIIEPAIFQRITLLIEGLVFQQSAAVGKKGRVKFVTEERQSPHRKTNFVKEKQLLSESVENFISDIFVTVFKFVSSKEYTMPLFFSLFKDLSVIHIPKHAAERVRNKSDPVADLVISEIGAKTETSFMNSIEGKSSQTSVETDSEGGNKFRDFIYDYLVKILLYVQQEETVKCSSKELFSDDVVVTIFAFVAYVGQEEGAKILVDVLDNLTEAQITCQFIEHLLGHVKYLPACQRIVAGTELARKIEQLTIAGVTGGERLDKNGGRVDGVCRAVWKMLTSVVSSLDESDNHLFSQSCLDAVVSNCLATLQQLRPCDLSQTADTVYSVVDLVLALFNKQKISVHPQLRELVLSLLPLLLRAEEEISRRLKIAWITGLKIILEKKSDAEIQQYILQLCAVVKQWVQASVCTYEGLLRVGRVIKMSLQTIASPSKEDESEEDDDGDELRESDNKSPVAAEDEIDEANLSAALDGLLMIDSVEVECWKEVCEYLYVSGRLLGLPPSFDPSEASRLPVQAYLTGTLYNLDVLLFNIELHRGKSLDTGSHPNSFHWSDSQLLIMAEMSYRLAVLETAVKLRPQEFKEFPSTILTDLQDKLIKCFRTLNKENLLFVVELAAQRNDRSYPVFTLGISSVLEMTSHSQQDETEKTMQQFSSALLSIRKSFLSRCLKTELVSEVSQLLDETGISGSSICEAFTLVSAAILSHEDVNLQTLADCVSGFLSLAKHCKILQDDLKLSLFQQVTVVVKELKERNIHLLSGSNTAKPSVDHLHFSSSISRALKSLVIPCHEYFWEFSLCFLVDWIQFLSKAKIDQTSDALTKTLFASACELVFLAAHTFSTAPVVKEAAAESSFVITEKAKTEWDEFFSAGVFSDLLPVFVSLASTPPISSEPLWTLVMLPLSSAVSLCPSGLVLAHQLPARLTTTDKSCISDSVKTLLNHLCPLLMSRLRCVEVAAYRLLSSIMEEIPKLDVSPEEEDKQEEELRSPPEALVHQVEVGGHFLEDLKRYQVHEHVEMDRGTDEHAHAMGYLLAWRLLLRLFSCSHNQLRAKYAQYFKASDMVSHLLDCLFRLMPQHPTLSMSELTAELSVQAEESESELSTLALYVYRQCLEILPALVRAWWMDQDRKSSNFVDKFTIQNLSSSLIRQQIASAQNTVNNIEGMAIMARPAAREVSATYEMAEVTVNMTITLPENYPLGKLEIACDKRVGASQAQWDRWLLQLNIFLQHQNGSIIEGLRLWKGNIDKKFEGVEDCMICFSVIHGTTFQLPRLTCKTCRKKFHSACLYKWFSTAQKSSCPLCRNSFV